LAILTVFLFVPVQFRKARDSKRTFDTNKIRKGLEEYYDTHLCYPAELPACGTPLGDSKAPFVAQIPCDPKDDSSYAYVTEGTSCNSWFQLYTNLEDTGSNLIEYVGCTYGCGPRCRYNYGTSSTNRDLSHCLPPPPPTPTPGPSSTPTPTPLPTVTPRPTNTPTPTPVPTIYVCAPGGGQTGSCLPFEFPEMSDCPKEYPNDPTCNNECADRSKHCKNSKGKNK